MSIWKEVKHALNSTLGTKNFQPLDQYLRSTKTIHVGDLNYKTIRQEQQLYSGKPLVLTKDASLAGETSKKLVVYAGNLPYTILKLKMLNNGSFYFGGEIDYNSSAGSYDRLNYNDRLIKVRDAIHIKVGESDGEATQVAYYKKGDIVEIYIDKPKAAAYTSDNLTDAFSPCIYGYVSDTSAFEYINWEEVSE